MKLQLISEKQSKASTSVIFMGFSQDGKNKKIKCQNTPSHMKSAIERTLEEEFFKGDKKEVFFSPHACNKEHLLFVGLGNLKQLNTEGVRQAASIAYKKLQEGRIQKANFLIDTISLKKKNDVIQALAEGITLTSYDYQGVRKEKATSKKTEIKNYDFVTKNAPLVSEKKALEKGLILAECTNFSKVLSDTPPNYMNPPILAQKAQEKARGIKNLKVTVWDKSRLKKEKMGGILGVSLGSGVEPRFIIMEYKGASPKKKPVFFVGKGLTFDSGGLSLKPAGHMADMKYDMCGGANVIGTLIAISKLKLKINAVGLIPSSENLVGEFATRPSDVITAKNGLTVEVLNTDAEGRLILMDALSYASEQKPVAIFNVATLTGAIVAALGNVYTGVFTKNDSLNKKIQEASKNTGEKVWRMPLAEVHREEMKSSYADLQNIGKTNGAGSSTAAGFLDHFVKEDIPWAHFDIAGTSDKSSNRLPYVPRTGATGVMLRTFVELAEKF